ncbi:MAG TPA: hybrid sensor histidine kinase/response regulator [Sphingobium sp.]|jgi:two-component system cell cycle sensor histidine kinase/response regulator CckA|uniref:hybrid sensor histidine kinase/response regulator n=1 Tax=unclassified Sphingobium TaxID=2611147 RepID=UPI0007F401B2|nr:MULTISPECIES: ATP-binding protein [unclassified Sphingobium]OAN55826.1 hybrid sensor histidine kinase/response regulator [Sphingobium sp. TCM1]WIW87777.1 response regulator [Sphingobium sp. V4]HAF42955.1 hybrid sensor histidine kinase/response regulator [Sphingobium sp.]
MAARLKKDDEAWLAKPASPFALPLLIGAALLSAGLVFYAAGSAPLAAGFAASILTIAALMSWYHRLNPAPLSDREATPDWTVARAAADASNIAIAVTDRAGRLVCASDLFGEWFPGYPTPPGVTGDAVLTESLSDTARAAWRDGDAKLEGMTLGAMRLDVDIARTGRSEDYLLWRFTPVRQPSALDDVHRFLTGEAGRQLGEAGIMAVMIGGEGRIRAANGAFMLRAAGRIDANITGRDFAAHMRVDDKGRLFLAREENGGLPLRLLQVPLRRASQPGGAQTSAQDGPMLLLLIDEPAGGGGTSALSYIETLLSLLPFGLAMADRDGRILFVNKAFARASGLKSGTKPSYPGDLVVREDQAAVADAVRRFAVGPQMSGDIAVRMREQPDEPIALSLAGVRGLGEAAVLLSLKDNSEESKLKRQVAQATKMQAIGQLAGGVAHDFNNILTAIIGHCDLMLMRHTPGDSDYDDIQQVKSNSNRAAGLTRQLLAFSRQQTLRPQILQLPDIVSDVSNLLKRLLGENVRLEVSHGRNLGAVRADPGQLEQVIVNLAVNARDAMPEGGTLNIQTYAVPASKVREMRQQILPVGDYTALRVSDTGLGIPPDILSKIFEPFFTTKELGKGTGLGLSTVYGIVKQSGGYIFAESELGRGASFVIYLPVYAGADADHVVPAQTPARRAETWGTGTILLVEDEDMVRAVAERALARQGYKVLTANDGEQGLEVLATHDGIDLLISDVVMPNMDGPAMVTQARRTHPLLPVLFMSGYAEEQLRKSIDIAHVAFLPKPFSVSQLAEAARDALAMRPAPAE